MRHNKLLLIFLLSILTFSLILVSCGSRGNDSGESQTSPDSNVDDKPVEVLQDLKACYQNNVQSLLNRNNISQEDKNRYRNSTVFTKDELKNISNINPKDQNIYNALSSYSEDVQSIWIKNSANVATTQAETTYSFDPSMINSDNVENLKTHLVNKGVIEVKQETHTVDNMLFLSFNQNDFELAGKLNRDGSGLIMDKNNEILFSATDVVGSVMIPSSVKRIQKEAFEGVENLTSVFIPNSVKVIEEDALVPLKKVNVTTNIKSPENDNLANELNKTNYQFEEIEPGINTNSWTKVNPVTNDEQGISISLTNNDNKIYTHSFKPLNGFNKKSFTNGKALNDKAVISECINAITNGTSLSLTLTNDDGEIKAYSAANCEMFISDNGAVYADLYTKDKLYIFETDLINQFYPVEYDENNKFTKYPFKDFLVGDDSEISPILNDAVKNSVYRNGFFVGSVNIEQLTIDYKIKIEEYQVIIEGTLISGNDRITSTITLYDLNNTFVVLPASATLTSDPHGNVETPNIEYETPVTILDAGYSHGFKISQEKVQGDMLLEDATSKIETIAPTKQTTNTTFYDINKENISLQIVSNIMNSYSFQLNVKECTLPCYDGDLNVGNYVIEPNSVYFRQKHYDDICEGVIIKTKDGNILVDNTNPKVTLPFSLRFPNEDSSYLNALDNELNIIEILKATSKFLTKDNNHVVGSSIIPIYTCLNFKYPVNVDYDIIFNPDCISMEYYIKQTEQINPHDGLYDINRKYKIELSNLNSAKFDYSFDHIHNIPDDYAEQIIDRFRPDLVIDDFICSYPDFTNTGLLFVHTWKDNRCDFIVIPTVNDSTFYSLANVVEPTCQTEGGCTASFVLYGKTCTFDLVLPPSPHIPDISKLGVCYSGISEDGTIDVLYSCKDCGSNTYVSLPALDDPRYVVDKTNNYCHEVNYTFYTINIDDNIYNFYVPHNPIRHDFTSEVRYDPNDLNYGKFHFKCKNCGYEGDITLGGLEMYNTTLLSPGTCFQLPYYNCKGSKTIKVNDEEYIFDLEFNAYDHFESTGHIIDNYVLKPCLVGGATLDKAGYVQRFCQRKGCDLVIDERYYVPALKTMEFYNYDNNRDVIQFRMGNYRDSIIVELDSPSPINYFAELADPNIMPGNDPYYDGPPYYHLTNLILNLNDNNGNCINDVYIKSMNLVDVIQAPTENQRGRGIYNSYNLDWVTFELEIPALSELNKEIPLSYVGKTYNNIFGYRRFIYDHNGVDELGNPKYIEFREYNDAFSLGFKSDKEILKYRDLIFYDAIGETLAGDTTKYYRVYKIDCYDHDYEIVDNGLHNQLLKCKNCGKTFWGDDENTIVKCESTCTTSGWGICEYEGIQFERRISRLDHQGVHYSYPEIGLEFDYCTVCKNIYNLDWRYHKDTNVPQFNIDQNNYIDSYFIPYMEKVLNDENVLIGDYRFGPYYECMFEYVNNTGQENITSYKIMTEIGIIYKNCDSYGWEILPYPEGVHYCEQDKFYLKFNNEEYNLMKKVLQDIKDKKCMYLYPSVITGKLTVGDTHIRYILESNNYITLHYGDRREKYSLEAYEYVDIFG